MTALKKSPYLFAVAAIAAGFSVPASAAGSARPGTEEALQCLLQKGPAGCQQVFAAQATLPGQFWVRPNARRDFNNGPLASADFWGAAARDNPIDQRVMQGQKQDEFDIYDVKFAHQELTFYIAPPDEDGKIRHVAILNGPPHDLNQLHRG